MKEKVAKTKSCNQCGASFDITDKDLEFYDKISPKFLGEKFSIPTPVLCSDCRAQNILSWRNERNLYKRKCDVSGKEIITIHSPDKNFKVYDQDIWRSDKLEGLDFGIEFDVQKKFFDQFIELYNNVPKISLNAPMSTNSKYTNQCQRNKDAYMMFCSGDNEACLYGMWNQNCNHCLDSLYVEYCENCYSIVNGKKCYNCYFSKNIENCNHIYFSNNLINCSYCLGCTNLENKKYYIFNKAYSKQKYLDKLNTLGINDYKNINILIGKHEKFSQDFPVKFYNGNINENFSGDYLESNKDTFECYNCRDNEKTYFCRDSWRVLYSHDLIETLQMEYCLQVEGSAFTNHCLFSMKLHECSNVFYSSHCNSSNNLFGCVGLKNKEYCILNKQYTKEEYTTKLPKIINYMIKTSEWGEFFPVLSSPFGYNETVAQEYFPLSKENALNLGFNWSEYKQPFGKIEKLIPADKLPNDINNIPDDILNWAIECEVTKKPFRIIPQELEYYRKHNLPIPRKHPDIRHLERMNSRNPRKLYENKCYKCEIQIKTTYSPDSKKLVYCEDCYNKEIY